ncbi:MAG: leucine-rich repeat domain-containing protein, partial [Clostridia bacterium]|nr:leucine-rich repeat domain-containing protein [Clostridia bacterium]
GATADYGPMMGAPWEAYALSVTAIRVEPGVTYLGSCAFRNLTIAKSVSLPDTLTGMGTAVFSSTGLASVSVPASITALPDHTFYYSDLTSVTLPDGLKTIGKNAFGDCYYLKRIVIPASVTEIGEEAFRANVTLVTTKGSAADRYAQENGLKVEYLN